jgi:transposase
MEYPSLDLRRRLVEAYRSKRSGTYEETAKVFGVGEATVSRLLRRFRETGDVKYKPVGGNNPRRVDLEWVRKHLEANPDVRLIDRVDAWERQSGRRVSVPCMWMAVRAVGWTHKKSRWSPANGTGRRSKRSAAPSR